MKVPTRISKHTRDKGFMKPAERKNWRITFNGQPINGDYVMVDSELGIAKRLLRDEHRRIVTKDQYFVYEDVPGKVEITHVSKLQENDPPPTAQG